MTNGEGKGGDVAAKGGERGKERARQMERERKGIWMGVRVKGRARKTEGEGGK